MKGTDVFVPRGVGQSAESIAGVLYAYYRARCKDEVLVKLRSTKQLLGMLTPEACQLYVDSIQEEVDPRASDEHQMAQEMDIQADMLENLGILAAK